MSPDARASRSERARQHRARGGKVLGVTPGRYPREIIEAAGLLPIELWDPPRPLDRSGAHLQSFACSVAHRTLEQLLAQPELLDGLLLPHLCDTMQNLGALVSECLAYPVPALSLYPPRGGNGQGQAVPYLTACFRRLGAGLAELAGRPMEDHALVRTRELRRERDRLLLELYEARSRRELTADNRQFYALVRETEYLPFDEQLATLAHALGSWTGSAAACASGHLPVVLSGLLPERGLLELLDQVGVAVVEDDLLSAGRRLLRAPPASVSDPWEASARDFIALPPCSSIASPLAERAEWLLSLVRRSGSRAVIFHTISFCEMELFDLPLLGRLLEAAGVPVLKLESELHDPAAGRLATRLEAFVEMLA